MDIYMVVLRLVHILGGVLWAGWAFVLVSFVEPAVEAAGPEGGKFMQALAGKTRLVPVMLVAPTLTILEAAGFKLSDVVRLNYYTSDVDRFFEAYDAVASRLVAAGCRSAGSLIGVARLAYPELLVEFEATAMA